MGAGPAATAVATLSPKCITGLTVLAHQGTVRCWYPQVYAPVDANPDDGFHRALYLFISPEVTEEGRLEACVELTPLLTS